MVVKKSYTESKASSTSPACFLVRHAVSSYTQRIIIKALENNNITGASIRINKK